jgi:D-aminoacyl-tRNA deacylase
MKTIVASVKDIAAMNMKRLLVQDYRFSETDMEFDRNKIYETGEFQIVTINKDSIYADYLDAEIDSELYIFASRHSSESEKPCLSVHSPGNFSDNLYGGNKKELAIAPSTVISGILRELERNRIDGFDVCLEVTHHGPTVLKKPVVFVEVGSTESQWKNLDACRAAVRAIMTHKVNGKSAIGFGGPHYAPKFTKLALEGWAIGHIYPKYHLKSLDMDLFRQMVEKTVPKPKVALVDKKGTKAWLKNTVKELSKDFDLSVEMV